MTELQLSTDDPAALSLHDRYAIEAAMIYPTNEGKRRIYLFAASDGARGNDQAWREIDAEVRAALNKGTIAGAVLLSVVLFHNDPASGLSTKEAAARMLTSRIACDSTLPATVRRVSQKTFDNAIWPAFRAASHLWAALVHRHMLVGGPLGLDKRDDLPVILSLADYYRSAAETMRTSGRAPGTILEPGAQWTFAAALSSRLPLADDKFLQLGPQVTPRQSATVLPFKRE